MGHGGDGQMDAGIGAATMETVVATLDRSKVHILLCDKDLPTSQHVTRLLQECSYQVTCVKSAGQVVGVLDSCSYEVDLILTEVELPREKGFKLLKHVVRQEQLRHIPVVMMSVQDEMPLVVKCLRLGAVDYLLKPLRTNELRNLWIHTWRRRRMLGLGERQSINGKFKVPLDLLLSETSESNNTNSTNFLSDDTEDLQRTVAMHEGATLASCEMESEMSPRLDLSLKPSIDLSRTSSNTGLVLPPPKRIALKVGQTSAFFTYDKVSQRASEGSGKVQCGTKTGEVQPYLPSYGQDDLQMKVGEDQEKHQEPLHITEELPHGSPYVWNISSGRDKNEPELVDIHGVSRNHESLPSEHSGGNGTAADQFPFMQFNGLNESGMAVNTVSMPSIPGSQFSIGGMMGTGLPAPSLLPPPIPMYRSLSQDDGVKIAPGIPSIQALSAAHGLPMAAAFSYYPFGLHLAAPQVGAFPGGWPSMMATPLMKHKCVQAERREAALRKFRRKRKDRCFEKKIRYVSRKKVAEQRPRIRGQFVRRASGIDMNGNCVLDEYDEDDDEQGFNDVGVGSSPESVAEDA